MTLPLIDKDNLTEYYQRIKELDAFDLCGSNLHEVNVNIVNSVNIPSHIFPQDKNDVIYRALICDSNHPIDLVKRISYNPEPAIKIGRANLVGESVFYASSVLDTAAIEACQDRIKSSDEMVFYLTIGKWMIKRELKINVICHSKKAKEMGNRLTEAAESIDTMMHKGRTADGYQIFLLESQFFSDQFAKETIKCQNDYLFSAICASELFNNPKSECDGIWYPSVGTRLNGYNAIYKPSLIDIGTIQLVDVSFVRIIFSNIDDYPKINTLNRTAKLENENIIWE